MQRVIVVYDAVEGLFYREKMEVVKGDGEKVSKKDLETKN